MQGCRSDLDLRVYSGILADGKAINLREPSARVPKEVLGSVRGVIDVLQEIEEALGVN